MGPTTVRFRGISSDLEEKRSRAFELSRHPNTRGARGDLSVSDGQEAQELREAAA